MWWRVKILKFPGPDSCERQAKVPEEVEPGQFSAVQCRVTPRDDETSEKLTNKEVDEMVQLQDVYMIPKSTSP